MKIKELNIADVREEITADVCVIGAAGGGLSAAVSAYESGAKKVVVLEKTNAPGGTTKMASGFFAVESPAQKRLGIHDNADDCFRQIISHLNWNVDAKLVREWMLNCGDSERWLEEKGLIFDYVDPFQAFPDVARRTCHTLHIGMHGGMEIVNTLTEDCEKKGIPILTKTRARHLLTDDNNHVVGVYATGKDDNRKDYGILIHAKAVILATGSISFNKDLISRFYKGDSYSDVKIMARVPHNTGDGFIMAEEIGAKQGEIATLFIGPHNHGVNSSELTGVLQRRPQPIKVDRYGERFIDESVFTDTDFGSMLSFNLDRQPGKICYIILDEKMLKDMIEKNERATMIEEYVYSYTSRDERYRGKDWLEGLYDDIKSEVACERMAVCQNLDEVADWIGCDHDTLKLTFEEYNTFCDNKYDADFLKPARHLIPLRTPPYYVIKGPSGIDTCIGGIQINHNLSVVNRDFEPIPGLYAAGVCTSGWLNKGYAYQGSELSFTLFSGRFAGKHAAEFAQGIVPKKRLYNKNASAKTFIAKADGDKEKGAYVINDKCIGCAACELACTKEAVYPIGKDKYQINVDKCVGCGSCAEVCCIGAITRIQK